MGIPDFIVHLRQKIGHDLLWIPAVTAVVLREGPSGAREVLLVERADNGAWTPVTGIVDPGEQPATAAAREVLEETAVTARAQALVRVQALPPTRHVNGDRAQYLDLTFRMTYVAGQPHADKDEVSNALWCSLDTLPRMSDEMHERIDAAASDQSHAKFSG